MNHDIYLNYILSSIIIDIHKYLWVQMMFIQWYEKIQRFLLQNTPSSLLDISTHIKLKSLWGFCIAIHMKYPGDNIENLCKVSRILPNGEKMKISHYKSTKKIVFVVVSFSS